MNDYFKIYMAGGRARLIKKLDWQLKAYIDKSFSELKNGNLVQNTADSIELLEKRLIILRKKGYLLRKMVDTG